MSGADSFELESLKPARHLAHSVPLEVKLSHPNPHTHSRERGHLREVENCITYAYFIGYK